MSNAAATPMIRVHPALGTFARTNPPHRIPLSPQAHTSPRCATLASSTPNAVAILLPVSARRFACRPLCAPNAVAIAACSPSGAIAIAVPSMHVPSSQANVWSSFLFCSGGTAPEPLALLACAKWTTLVPGAWDTSGASMGLQSVQGPKALPETRANNDVRHVMKKVLKGKDDFCTHLFPLPSYPPP